MRDFVLVAAVALIAFGATLGGSFHFDDYSLFQNPSVVSPDGWHDLFRAEQTRPLTFLTFWLNYQLGGQDPIGYHAVNLALHVAAALLLLRVARRIAPDDGVRRGPGGPPHTALIAACLFAAHPFVTEPVAYVFARGTLLMTIFCLLSLNAWLRDRPWIALAWFVAALLAKEECAAFPMVLAVFEWRERERPRWPALAMMTLASLAAGLRVIYAVRVTPGAMAGTRAGVSLVGYAAAQGPVLLRYMVQTVIPWWFTPDPQIGPYAVWQLVLAWAIAGALVWAAARWSFWAVAALIVILPSSSVFPASDIAADRRMYLPLCFLAIAVAPLFARLRRPWRAVVVAILCAISIRYSLVWRTEESLWTEAVERAPRKVRPRIHLARAVDPARGLALLRDAESIAPADPAIASEEGRIYLAAGLAPQALAAFGRALALDPDNPDAIQNRGAALLALGQRGAALSDFKRALLRDPCQFEARLNLGQLGAGSGSVPSNCRFTPDQMKQLQ